MNKKILISIVFIAIVILIIFVINNSKIVAPIATITGEEISSLNSHFEEFEGINKSEDLERLLQYCIKNYKENFYEFIKIPKIKYITDGNETILKFDDQNLKEKTEETEYYLGINEILENLSSDKSYKVELKYMEKSSDNVALIEEIKIDEI